MLQLCDVTRTRGLRLSCAAASLLGLRVRIPQEHGSQSRVNVVYCVGRSSWDWPISCLGEPYQICVYMCLCN